MTSVAKKPRIYFLFAITLGLGIALLRALFELDNLWVVLAMATLIAGYWYLVKQQKDKSYYSSEQFADSLYLMGFLFTLISLMVGLSLWSESAPEQIIGQNAIALGTTIVGMGLRVLARQFVVNAQSDEAGAAIEDLARYVDEVGKIARRLESSFVRLASATDDAKSSLSASATQIKDVNVPRYVLSDKLASVEVPTAAFADLIRRLEAPMDTLSDRMKRSFSTVEEELAGLASALANLRRRLGVVEETVDGAEGKDTVRVPPTGIGPAASLGSLFRRRGSGS